MITVLLSVFCLIAGYLLGSIMSAVKIARSKSTDIHACGSGNAGSTNVLRTFGWKWGLICLASDSAKGAASVGVGYAAAAIAPALFSNYVMPENLSGILGCIGLLGAILGHLLPVFYEFRGGKCVAVALGGLLVLSPVQLLIGCAVILIAITKMVSVGSVVGTIIATALVIYRNRGNIPLMLIAVVIAAVVITAHLPNIRRIMEQTQAVLPHTKIYLMAFYPDGSKKSSGRNSRLKKKKHAAAVKMTKTPQTSPDKLRLIVNPNAALIKLCMLNRY